MTLSIMIGQIIFHGVPGINCKLAQLNKSLKEYRRQYGLTTLMCVSFWGEWCADVLVLFVVISISPITVWLLADNLAWKLPRPKNNGA